MGIFTNKIIKCSKFQNREKTTMKTIIKLLKGVGKIIIGIILFIVIAGLCYKLFSSAPKPPGELVDVNGTKIHIRAEGSKNNLPTLILEAGANNNTDVFHWVAEGLKQNFRVIRYDREGKWFSESSQEKFTPEFYAKQLHDLLEKNGEKPPYILVGHSMGGPYNQIFRDLYPKEVKGMVFLDSSHPEQWMRLAQNELIPENQINTIRFIEILADMGIMGIYNKISSRKPFKDDLPEECQTNARYMTYHSGKVFNRYLKENEINKNILSRAGKTKSLDSLPVLVFTATEQYREFQKEKYRKQGIDPDKQVELWLNMQQELKNLSTQGKQFIIDSNHGSIITKKENAEIINKEILLMAKGIEKYCIKNTDGINSNF